jgi:hypothetical protein
MKTLISTLFALLAISATAATYVTVDGIHYRIDETAKTACVVCRQYDGQSEEDSWMWYSADQLYVGDITIPTKFTYNENEYAVTSIGGSAFAGSKQMTSLTLPATVTTFGTGTFSLCNALQTITVDGENPKYQSLDGIMYARSPMAIFFVPRAISGNITLPDGLTEISSSAFQNCTQITSVTMPNSVTTIKDAAFSGCTSLLEVNFSTALKSIERNAFNQCTSFAMVDFQKTQLKTIDFQAFNSCTNLVWLYLGNHLKTIGRSAFEDCAMQALRLPATLQSIGENAFRGCTQLAIIQNLSALTLTQGSTDNGYVAYYATQITGADTPTNLAENQQNLPQISICGRQITIASAQNLSIKVYAANGKLVYHSENSDNQTITLPNSGIYLVKIGENIQKIVIK